MSRAPTAPEAANHRARRPRSVAPGRHRGCEPPGGRDGTGRGGPGWGGGGSGRGGAWRRRPSRAAPPGGLVSRAPGAGDPHPRELPGHRSSPHPHLPPLEPRRTIQPPGEGTWSHQRDSPPPPSRGSAGMSRTPPHAPPAPSPSAGPLQLLAPATLSSAFGPWWLRECSSPLAGG